MRATPSARALAVAAGLLDRFWGPIGVAVVAVLEATVFGPRGMAEAMIGGGILAAGLLIGWLAGVSR